MSVTVSMEPAITRLASAGDSLTEPRAALPAGYPFQTKIPAKPACVAFAGQYSLSVQLWILGLNPGNGMVLPLISTDIYP